MKQLFDALKSALAAEKEAYVTFFSLSERKKEILIKNDVEALNKITREEGNCIKALKALSLERETFVKQIAWEKGLSGIINLDDVIAFAGGQLANELSELKNEFNMVIFNLSRLNELNKKLIETHMQYTSFCIEAVTQPVVAGDTYSSTGHVSDGNKNMFGLIDQKI